MGFILDFYQSAIFKMETENESQTQKTPWESVIKDAKKDVEKNVATKSSKSSNQFCHTSNIFFLKVVGSSVVNFSIGITFLVVGSSQNCSVDDITKYLQVMGAIMIAYSVVFGLLLTQMCRLKTRDYDGCFRTVVLYGISIAFGLVQIGVLIKTTIVVCGSYDDWNKDESGYEYFMAAYVLLIVKWVLLAIESVIIVTIGCHPKSFASILK